MRWPMPIASAAFGLAPLEALTHGGGLDASGCHTNKKTGDYYCHGGAAPSSGGGSTGSGSGSKGTMYIAPAPAPAPRRSEPKLIAAVATGPTTLVSLGDGDTIRVSTPMVRR